jgi:hypothetical protein
LPNPGALQSPALFGAAGFSLPLLSAVGGGVLLADYDGPWKEALDLYFEAFIALFFPAMHGEIDWRRPYVTLDKELQKVTPDAEQGRRFVDKLVQVWRIDGQEEWVLIHLEVQAQEESQFALRMFVYNCRLVERYNRPVVSVAVLADEDPRWQPQGFRRELWGCSTDFRFPIVKLLDYAAQSDALEQSDNPFAKFVLAHLKTLETRRDDDTRFAWKLRLVRGLFERGLAADEIRKLFRLIDWLMALPSALEEQFRDELTRIQEEKHMPYVTSIERLAKEEGWKQGQEEGWKKGREEGLKRGIRAALESRFGDEGLRLMEEIEALHDSHLLETILEQAHRAASPGQLRACWKQS